MPGAYPRTSTLILTHTTLPYIERLCNRGSDALTDDPVFASAINCLGGKIRCRPVAEALDLLDHYQGPD
jgi:alanine dehydrogenase